MCVKVANAGVALNATNFPDQKFFTFVFTFADINKNLYLSDSELANLTVINVSEWSISNLKGIEYFTSLKELDCSYNPDLTNLDLTSNTKLEVLACKWCNLTSLNVSKCTELTDLDCWGNQLTTLNLQNNTKLVNLNCPNNKLTSLNVAKNTVLTKLECYDNQLTSLDVHNNTKLKTLNCNNNKLTSLNVAKCTVLTAIFCENNQLTSLDVHENTNLNNLNCNGNKLTSLDLSKNGWLMFLYCANNKIKGSAMDALIAGLNNNANGKLNIIAPYISEEQNVLTTTQLKAAQEKKWKVQYWTGSTWDTGEWATYSTVGIADIEYATPTDTRYYTLDGKPLDGKPAQKGIYILNGRKVVVK